MNILSRTAFLQPWLRQFVPYLLFTVATCVLMIWGMRLDHFDLRTPLSYSGDTLLILPLVKNVIEHGTHWHTDRLGAPGIQELYDFPIIDYFHFCIIWLLSFINTDAMFVYNLYHILTYPLTTIMTMIVMRQLGLSVPTAGTGAVLYTFLPYHYIRGLAHYFLAAYYIVPLTLLVAVWIATGETPFLTSVSNGNSDGNSNETRRIHLFTWRSFVVVLIAIMTATGGAYYAFFGCAILAFAGLYHFVLHHSVRALVSCCCVLALIVTIGVAQHLPTAIYHKEHGRNSAPTQRGSEEAENYALKMSQMLLPTQNHRNVWLERLIAAFDSPDRPAHNGDNRPATLGLIGSAGFLTLLMLCLLPIPRHPLLGAIAALTMFAFLLGTLGGFGALFAHLISPQVRGYSRISIFIAFFALWVVMWFVDRLATSAWWPRFVQRNNLGLWLCCVALLGLGMWDQTNRYWFRSIQVRVREPCLLDYQQDAAYFHAIEETLGTGSVFLLPMVPYPESQPVLKLGGYDHARGYLHTKSLRWSFGAMRGREADLWQREVVASPPKVMLEKLVLRGFNGLIIDRRGYPPAEVDQLQADVQRLLGPDVKPFVHPDQQQFFYDLRPFAARWKQELGPKFEERRVQDQEAVTILWMDGFQSFEAIGHESLHRWCAKNGEAFVVNPSSRPRTCKLSMVYRTQLQQPAHLRVSSTFWNQELDITAISDRVELTVTIPPGRHTVRFHCDPPTEWQPNHSRQHLWFVAQFTLTEQVGSTP